MSYGVIGGADGPTTTFVAGFFFGSPLAFAVMLGGGLLLAAMAIGLLVSAAKRNSD